MTSLHFPCLFPHLSVLSLHCIKMPGSSLISGLLLCSSYRRTHGADKPKTVTYDAQIFVDLDAENNIRSCIAVLHYFVPFGQQNLLREGIFFVSGKLSMVDENTPIGDDFNWEDYVFQIQATSVHLRSFY